METTTVLSTPCLLTDFRRLTKLIEERCQHEKSEVESPLSVDFTNAHIIALRDTNKEFRETTGSVDLFVSDSQIVSWAISLLGGKNHERVYGPSFLDHFVRIADDSLTHYFLGGSQDCLERLLKVCVQRRPTLKVAGSHHGYFSDELGEKIFSDINENSPDCLWVGLGTPKQQLWIDRNKHRLNAKAVLAVGFAFDVNAGTKKDAPAWMGSAGLTWLYRFSSEPKRLFKRYMVYNTVFIVRLALQLVMNICRR